MLPCWRSNLTPRITQVSWPVLTLVVLTLRYQISATNHSRAFSILRAHAQIQPSTAYAYKSRVGERVHTNLLALLSGCAYDIYWNPPGARHM